MVDITKLGATKPKYQTLLTDEISKTTHGTANRQRSRAGDLEGCRTELRSACGWAAAGWAWMRRLGMAWMWRRLIR